MVWSRLIVVDKGRTQVFDGNNQKIVVASVNAIKKGALRGMSFDEVEWAASNFDEDVFELEILPVWRNAPVNKIPRRLISLYMSENGKAFSIVNGVPIGQWAKLDLLLELQRLIDWFKWGISHGSDKD